MSRSDGFLVTRRYPVQWRWKEKWLDVVSGGSMEMSDNFRMGRRRAEKNQGWRYLSAIHISAPFALRYEHRRKFLTLFLAFAALGRTYFQRISIALGCSREPREGRRRKEWAKMRAVKIRRNNLAVYIAIREINQTHGLQFCEYTRPSVLTSELASSLQVSSREASFETILPESGTRNRPFTSMSTWWTIQETSWR